jgi:hypothetical protein
MGAVISESKDRAKNNLRMQVVLVTRVDGHEVRSYWLGQVRSKEFSEIVKRAEMLELTAEPVQERLYRETLGNKFPSIRRT